MRDIIQVSCAIQNPYTGINIAGSTIEPITPPEDNGFILDILGYLYNTGELFFDGELFT